MSPQLWELLQLESPPWLEILSTSIAKEDAQYVDPATNLTLLHLAVMSNDTNKKDNNTDVSRLAVIRQLLELDWTATEVCCLARGFTPLMYACLVQEDITQSLQWNVPVVKVLMEYNPKAIRIHSPLGRSALDLHILSMSHWHQEKSPMRHSFQRTPIRSTTKAPPPGTECLQALVEYDLGIALVRGLELLLACNTLEVMEYVAQEEAHAMIRRLEDRRRQRKHPNHQALPWSNGSRRVPGFWVWEFLVTMLRAEHYHTFQDVKPLPPFNALHVASQMDDFPLPFLMLCMRVYPAQIHTPSVVKSDLPVHAVASWNVRCKSKMARKSMTLTQLLTESPTSSRHKNEDGKTPFMIAVETGTAWNMGLRRLTMAQNE